MIMLYRSFSTKKKSVVNKKKTVVNNKKAVVNKKGPFKTRTPSQMKKFLASDVYRDFLPFVKNKGVVTAHDLGIVYLNLNGFVKSTKLNNDQVLGGITKLMMTPFPKKRFKYARDYHKLNYFVGSFIKDYYSKKRTDLRYWKFSLALSQQKLAPSRTIPITKLSNLSDIKSNLNNMMARIDPYPYSKFSKFLSDFKTLNGGKVPFSRNKEYITFSYDPLPLFYTVRSGLKFSKEQVRSTPIVDKLNSLKSSPKFSKKNFPLINLKGSEISKLYMFTFYKFAMKSLKVPSKKPDRFIDHRKLFYNRNKMSKRTLLNMENILTNKGISLPRTNSRSKRIRFVKRRRHFTRKIQGMRRYNKNVKTYVRPLRTLKSRSKNAFYVNNNELVYRDFSFQRVDPVTNSFNSVGEKGIHYPSLIRSPLRDKKIDLDSVYIHGLYKNKLFSKKSSAKPKKDYDFIDLVERGVIRAIQSPSLAEIRSPYIFNRSSIVRKLSKFSEVYKDFISNRVVPTSSILPGRYKDRYKAIKMGSDLNTTPRFKLASFPIIKVTNPNNIFDLVSNPNPIVSPSGYKPRFKHNRLVYHFKTLPKFEWDKTLSPSVNMIIRNRRRKFISDPFIDGEKSGYYPFTMDNSEGKGLHLKDFYLRGKFSYYANPSRVNNKKKKNNIKPVKKFSKRFNILCMGLPKGEKGNYWRYNDYLNSFDTRTFFKNHA